MQGQGLVEIIMQPIACPDVFLYRVAISSDELLRNKTKIIHQHYNVLVKLPNF